MRSTLLLAGSCLLASVISAPTSQQAQGGAKQLNERVGAVAEAMKRPPYEPHRGYWDHHDGDTEDDDNEDDDDDNDDDDDDDESERHHHHKEHHEEHHDNPHPLHPAHPPTCPTCPKLPPPPPICLPSQPVKNPGLEELGGSLQYWKPSDPQTVLIDSQNGEPDALGAHSALMIFNTNNVASSMSQKIRVCPKSVYRIYIAIKVFASGGGGSSNSQYQQGSFKDVSQCNVFLGIEGAGNATIPGSSLAPGAYTTFTTANTFTTGPTMDSNIWVAVTCATGAFHSTAQQGGAPTSGHMYIDNVQMVPQK